MFRSPWLPADQSVALELNDFRAVASFARPWDGLSKTVVAGHSLGAARLLAISRDADAADIRPIESYVRGADLVTAYEEAGRWPVRVDALWRAVPPTAADRFLAAVDVVVSVRTSLLDCHPDVSVYSLVPSDEVLRLANAESGVCTPLAVSPLATTRIGPESGAGCLLIRPRGLQLSYVEMVHPTDFQHDELIPSEPNMSHIAHRLFRTNLEKGVILRARVRGVFLRRQNDREAAAQCYAAFAASDPLLGA